MIDRVIEARAFVLGTFVCLLVLAAFGASRLAIDPNNRVFFAANHEHFSNLLDLEARFGSNTSLLFVVSSPSALGKNSEIPTAIRWLSDSVWEISQVTEVASIATYPHVYGSQNQLVIDNLLDYVCPPAAECASKRMQALEKPYLVGRVLSDDKKTFAVIADVDLSDPTPGEVTAIASQAKELKSKLHARFPSLSVYLTGGVPMMQAFVDAASRDAESLIAVAIGVLAIGLVFFLGGLMPATLMLVLGASSVLITMGIAGWLGFVINTATATVPLIVLTLVVASAMHVFLYIVREDGIRSRTGRAKAIKTSIAANWRPVFLTAATTVLGLLSMVFVSAPPLRELGILTATGVATGALLSVTVIPCLFMYLPVRRASNWLSALQVGMNRYARWLEMSRPVVLSLAVLAIFGVALLGLRSVSIDEDFVRYFSPDTEFRNDTEAITRLLVSPYHVDITFDSGKSAGVYAPESIRRIEALVGFLRSRPQVANVASIIDPLRETSAVMAGDDSLGGRTTNELAQFFLSYELSLGVGQTTRDLVDSDHRRARISVLLHDISMAQIRSFVESVNSWAKAHDEAKQIVVSGEGVPTAYLSSESIEEMGMGIGISVCVSSLLVGLYFRSARASLTIFLATVIPIMSGFGAWGWIESDIGIAATLVVAITIGVVIDDTIHLTYRYLDSYRNLDLTSWGAVAYSVHKTGTAIVVTSVILVAGLLVLLGSEFRMNSTFGLCSSLIIALALVYNLTIAPYALRRLG